MAKNNGRLTVEELAELARIRGEIATEQQEIDAGLDYLRSRDEFHSLDDNELRRAYYLADFVREETAGMSHEDLTTIMRGVTYAGDKVRAALYRRYSKRRIDELELIDNRRMPLISAWTSLEPLLAGDHAERLAELQERQAALNGIKAEIGEAEQPRRLEAMGITPPASQE